ncbi:MULTISPECIES: EmmdR/YeeO family multidrug/toxin efflux MATE transporter [unclassified Agarivorans]|uniref:EmmdR/YeeO family multidrug/toxin efflux MATE transporter n=1 Tax=unclassified Agarivorans TaxID=2636026 RepID=UPI003D7D53EE
MSRQILSKSPQVLTSSLSPAIQWRYYYRYRVLLARNIIPFAWPILIELACVVLMGIVSTILVSRLGNVQTAAVGVSDSVTFIIISVLMAVGLGGSVLIAHAFGKRDMQKVGAGAPQVVNLAIVFSLLAGLGIFVFAKPLLQVIAYGADEQVIAMAATYLKTIAFSFPALAIVFAGSGVLRAVGNSRLPAMSNILMNLLNIVFSYPLIYGFHWLGGDVWQGFGLIGAGLGICVARWAGALMILYCLANNQHFNLKLKSYITAFNRIILREILGIGIPASVESMMFNVGKLITQMMVAGMGTAAMAGNVVAFSIALLINIPGNALAITCTVLIGRRLGQDKPNVAQRELRLCFYFATALIVSFAGLSALFAEQLARLYTSEPEVIEIVVKLIHMNALMSPIWAASFVLPNAFKGAKDVKYTMWTAIVSMWGCRIVLGYVLGIVWGLGVYGVWLGMFADWWFRGALYCWRLINLRWLHPYLQSKSG